MLILTITAPVFYAGPTFAVKVDASGHRELSATVNRVASGLVSVKTEEGTTRYFTLKEAERNGLPSMNLGDRVLIEMDEGNQIIDIHGEKSHRVHAPSVGEREISATVKKIDGGLISVKTEVGTTRYFTVKEAVRKGLGSMSLGSELRLVIDAGNQITDIQGVARHRSVTAKVEDFHRSDKVITVRTEEGNKETFEFKEPVVTKLVVLKEGTEITFEIDEQNRIMDLHPTEG